METGKAGLLLLVPDLVALDLPGLVRRAGYPGTRIVPAASWLLSLLALKLTRTRRVSHVDDLLLADPAAALFAGLTTLPKKTALTDYSYRTSHEHQRRFLAALDTNMIKGGLVTGQDAIFDLDFHAVMHWANRGRGAGDHLGRDFDRAGGFFARPRHTPGWSPRRCPGSGPRITSPSRRWPPKGRSRVGDALARSAGMLAALENGPVRSLVICRSWRRRWSAGSRARTNLMLCGGADRVRPFSSSAAGEVVAIAAPVGVQAGKAPQPAGRWFR